MEIKRGYVLSSVLLIGGLLLAACAEPTQVSARVDLPEYDRYDYRVKIGYSLICFSEVYPKVTSSNGMNQVEASEVVCADASPNRIDELAQYGLVEGQKMENLLLSTSETVTVLPNN